MLAQTSPRDRLKCDLLAATGQPRNGGNGKPPRDLDVLEDVAAGMGARLEGMVSNEILLQRREEALCDGIVRVLATAIALEDQPRSGLSLAHGGVQRFADQRGRHALCEAPTDDFARVQVEDRSQVQPMAPGPVERNRASRGSSSSAYFDSAGNVAIVGHAVISARCTKKDMLRSSRAATSASSA
jgi:hypothetical protein